MCLASSVSCAEEKAEKKSVEVEAAANEGAEKKQEKRGVFGEGYGHFDGGWGDHGHHGWEEDHHHIHHHHEKTIYNVKKIPAPYPVEKHVHVPVHKTIHVPHNVHVPQPYPGLIQVFSLYFLFSVF